MISDYDLLSHKPFYLSMWPYAMLKKQKKKREKKQKQILFDNFISPLPPSETEQRSYPCKMVVRKKRELWVGPTLWWGNSRAVNRSAARVLLGAGNSDEDSGSVVFQSGLLFHTLSLHVLPISALPTTLQIYAIQGKLCLTCWLKGLPP